MDWRLCITLLRVWVGRKGNEANSLYEGWWERLELLYIRQHMAVLAFFGNQYNTLQQLRDVISKFT